MGLNWKWIPLLSICLLGCEPALNRQPKLKEYSVSKFFPNESAARDPVEGTMPFLKSPFAAPKVTAELLELGRQKFDIYCTACHGWTGHGDGMAVQRGFPSPGSLHDDLFRTRPPEFFIGCMTKGGALMPSCAAKLS